MPSDNTPEKWQDIIDRYVYDTVRRLPKGQRGDIELELRTLIDDMLAGQNSQAAVESVLTSLGNPAELARKYRDEEKYVIGPEYYETYILVLKIVSLCVLAGVVVSAFVQAFTVGEINGLSAAAGKVFSVVISGFISVVTAFGFVTLVFAAMDRQKVKIDLTSGEKWTPGSLPPIPDNKGLIKRSDSIVGIVFTLLFCGLLIFVPRLFGAWYSQDGQPVSIPVFNLDIWPAAVPLLLISVGSGLVDEIVKLAMGRYCPAVAASNAITGVAGLVASAVVLKVLPIWNPSFATEVEQAFHLDISSGSDILFYWNTDLISNILLGIIFAGTLLDIGVTVYKSVRYGRQA